MALHALPYLPTFLSSRHVHVWESLKLVTKLQVEIARRADLGWTVGQRFARQNDGDVTPCDFHLTLA
eukprot:5970799-Pleurochrysis_carterae.AAC.1